MLSLVFDQVCCSTAGLGIYFFFSVFKSKLDCFLHRWLANLLIVDVLEVISSWICFYVSPANRKMLCGDYLKIYEPYLHCSPIFLV